MSANGTFSRRSSQSAQKDQQLASLRDLAVIMATICGLATYFVEPPISRDAISWEPVYRELQGDWKTLHYHRTVQQCLLMILVNTAVNWLLFYMVSPAVAVGGTVFHHSFTRVCLVAWSTQAFLKI